MAQWASQEIGLPLCTRPIGFVLNRHFANSENGFHFRKGGCFPGGGYHQRVWHGSWDRMHDRRQLWARIGRKHRNKPGANPSFNLKFVRRENKHSALMCVCEQENNQSSAVGEGSVSNSVENWYCGSLLAILPGPLRIERDWENKRLQKLHVHWTV